MRGLLVLPTMLALLTILPAVSALDVNVMYGGQIRQTTQFNAEDVMNWDISIGRNATDFMWSRVNVHVSVISGDSARPIGKLYLYRCKAYNPIDCITKVDVPEPLEFVSYADVDLSWNDISSSSGNARYPQVANLLFVARLEGENEAWTGLFVTVERVDYNQFNVPFNYELDSVNVFPKNENLIVPVKDYVDNFHMIPMKWVDRVTFSGTSGLYALGANSEDFESQPVNFRPERPVGEIRQITKDFYLVFPETVEGTANPITLNLNPTSECGDGTCQASLGESSGTCCYDCACPSGQFCDLKDPSDPAGGVCRETSMFLRVSGLFQDTITNCESGGFSRFTASITNPPSGLTNTEFSGSLQIEDFILPVDCSGSSLNALECSFEYSTEIVCGAVDREAEYVFTLPVEYYDGQNAVMADLRADNVGNPLTIRYRCGCDEGMFCDLRENACQDEESMSLELLEFNTPKYNIDSGGLIKMFVQIGYAPLNYKVTSTRYNIVEILQDEDILPGLSGMMNCTPYEDYGEPDVYGCEIRYEIAGYDRELEYTLNNNKIIFKISYNDVGAEKTRTLSTDIPEVVIPPSECGDGRCDKEKGETEKTCCMDCGCGKDEDLYCDEKKGCQSVSALRLSVQSASPTSFEDCAEDHAMKVKATIGKASQAPSKESGGGMAGQITGLVTKESSAKFGVPTGISVDSYELFEDGGLSEYASLSCSEINEATGALSCQVEIQPIEECKTAKTLGPFEMQVMVSWPNGAEDIVEKTLTAQIPSVSVKPVFHPGDGVCEENYGESGANSCVDCPCEEDPKFGSGFYCDVGSGGSKTGTCKPMSGVQLKIESPSQPVHFPSCDTDNEVQIKARIVNAPGGTNLEHAAATLNGNDAKVSCTPLFGAGVGGGLRPVSEGGSFTGWTVAEPGITGMGIAPTPSEQPCVGCGIKPPGGMVGTGAGVPYNCVLVVPAEDGCVPDKEYRYTAVLSLYISYYNGKNTDIGVVSTGLPEIVTNSKEKGEQVETEEIEANVADVERSIEEKLKVIEELKGVESECKRWLSSTNIASLGKTAGIVVADLGLAFLCAAFPESGCSPTDVLIGGAEQAIKEMTGADVKLDSGPEESGGKTTTEGEETGPATLTGMTVIAREDADVVSEDGGGGNDESALKRTWDAVIEVGGKLTEVVDIEAEGVNIFTKDGLAVELDVPGLHGMLNGDGFKWVEAPNLGEFSFDFLDLDKKAGKLVVDMGADLIRSQRAKCEVAKTAREEIEKDLQLETEEVVFLKCIETLQKRYAAGECEGTGAVLCKNELQRCIMDLQRKLGEYGYMVESTYNKIIKSRQDAEAAATQAAKKGGHWQSSQGDSLAFYCDGADGGPTNYCCGTDKTARIEVKCAEGTTGMVVKLGDKTLEDKTVEGNTEAMSFSITRAGTSITDLFDSNGEYTLSLVCSGGHNVGGGFDVCYCNGCEDEYVKDNCKACDKDKYREAAVKGLCTPDIIAFCESQGKVCDEDSGKCVECETDEDCVKKGLKRCLKEDVTTAAPKCVECTDDADCATGYCDKNNCIGPDISIALGSVAVCLTEDGEGIDVIGFYVENQGEETIFKDFQVRLDTERADGGEDHLNLDMVHRLDSGKKVWRYRNFIGARVKKVTISADHENIVKETNEDNNKREVKLGYDKTVAGADEVYKRSECPSFKSAPAGLDLKGAGGVQGNPLLFVVADSIDVEVDHSEKGNRIKTVSFKVKNQGSGSSDASDNGIRITEYHYEGNDLTKTPKKVEKYLKIPSLGRGEEHEIEKWKWYVNYLPGNDYVAKIEILVVQGGDCVAVNVAGFVGGC